MVKDTTRSERRCTGGNQVGLFPQSMMRFRLAQFGPVLKSPPRIVLLSPLRLVNLTKFRQQGLLKGHTPTLR